MRWRSDLQTEEFSRQMPIGKMQDPMHRTPSFDFAIAEPRSQGQKEPDDNVLSEINMMPQVKGITITRNSSRVQNPISSGSSRCFGIEYWSKDQLRQREDKERQPKG